MSQHPAGKDIRATDFGMKISDFLENTEKLLISV